MDQHVVEDDKKILGLRKKEEVSESSYKGRRNTRGIWETEECKEHLVYIIK